MQWFFKTVLMLPCKMLNILCLPECSEMIRVPVLKRTEYFYYVVTQEYGVRLHVQISLNMSFTLLSKEVNEVRNF